VIRASFLHQHACDTSAHPSDTNKSEVNCVGGGELRWNRENNAAPISVPSCPCYDSRREHRCVPVAALRYDPRNELERYDRCG
jgi:hypothetical protein